MSPGSEQSSLSGKVNGAVKECPLVAIIGTTAGRGDNWEEFNKKGMLLHKAAGALNRSPSHYLKGRFMKINLHIDLFLTQKYPLTPKNLKG